MKERIMDMDVDWERIKNEQLSFLLEQQADAKGGMNPVMTVASGDIRESTLKTLVQQAARN